MEFIATVEKMNVINSSPGRSGHNCNYCRETWEIVEGTEQKPTQQDKLVEWKFWDDEAKSIIELG